jgi:hypothetical protein
VSSADQNLQHLQKLCKHPVFSQVKICDIVVVGNVVCCLKKKVELLLCSPSFWITRGCFICAQPVILLYYAFDSPILVTIRLITNSFRCVGWHLGSE